MIFKNLIAPFIPVENVAAAATSSSSSSSSSTITKMDQ